MGLLPLFAVFQVINLLFGVFQVAPPVFLLNLSVRAFATARQQLHHRFRSLTVALGWKTCSRITLRQACCASLCPAARLRSAATQPISSAGSTTVVTDKRTLEADLVLVAAGVRPNTEIAAEAGVALGLRGAIKVDDHMRTAVERIWAAGDCVETVQLVTGRPYWMSAATVSSKQGRVAGANITGGDASFAGTLGTMITKAGPVEIARTGLQETELSGGDIRFVTATVNTITSARYYPDSEPMTVKLVGEVGSGRLLGGQIVGGRGAAMRINVVVTALHAGMTVDLLTELDLAYAPPFSAVWDPILLAARELRAKF